ncbi:hypothetical protein RHABOEDO_000605 [Candidatus Rhabdochlamydia oedothoracis]|uniref:Uncharacterized protein n=1 Tax=Candidatus Rhabdochlamydia oedothoracis TaxID=2720720 RepID=A0ABX8V5E1_9BACT|nr:MULTISPECIES: hypothetical protein [Rhabdochlamydia]KAG6558794.1 hypothetical protein RHOW815_001205 [Candidatus Rhabdochlamydia sp. W815]MCL6756566.1 hypothetical protein [Candidatus Rhabdochlamydia oedothoracis]QYF48444.1 hypothetical protein RHABOEDO_000605 [Candidatus Rhabdochlamydia oedothoracis]
MYYAIAVYKEMFLCFSLSTLFAGLVLGIIISLGGCYYRFTTGNADVFVHMSILRNYVECYAHQAFPSQNLTIKVCLNRYNEITVVLDLLKQVDDTQVFEQAEKDLSALFSCYLGHQKPLFLEITYLRNLS